MVANSAAITEHARRFGFHRIAVVPLATDMPPANPPSPPESVVFFAGRLIERKGCAWFIRHVLPTLPDPIRLKVAGTIWSDSEHEALRHPRVDYIGPQEPSVMAELYAKALRVVTPNIILPNGEFEGFGLVATEAAACGGVSLASPGGGLPQAVVDGVTGFLLPPGTPDPWIAKIKQIMEWSAEVRTDFITRSVATTQKHYSWSGVAAETIEAYQLERV